MSGPVLMYSLGRYVYYLMTDNGIVCSAKYLLHCIHTPLRYINIIIYIYNRVVKLCLFYYFTCRTSILREVDNEEQQRKWFYDQLDTLTKRLDTLPLSDKVNINVSGIMYSCVWRYNDGFTCFLRFNFVQYTVYLYCSTCECGHLQRTQHTCCSAHYVGLRPLYKITNVGQK